MQAKKEGRIVAEQSIEGGFLTIIGKDEVNGYGLGKNNYEARRS